MAIYEYLCRECGKRFELRRAIADAESQARCTECGSRPVTVLLSTPHILKTDQRSGATCCGREERCERPPCSSGESCHRK